MNYKKIILGVICFITFILLVSSGNYILINYGMALATTFFAPIFIEILSTIIIDNYNKKKKTFITLFILRILVLVIVIPFFQEIVFIDGVIIVFGIAILNSFYQKKKIDLELKVEKPAGVKIKCENCGYEMNENNKVCPKCWKER